MMNILLVREPRLPEVDLIIDHPWEEGKTTSIELLRAHHCTCTLLGDPFDDAVAHKHIGHAHAFRIHHLCIPDHPIVHGRWIRARI